MATPISRENKEKDLSDGFKREWAGPIHPCTNPGCEIPTRSEMGECAVCVVVRRADERVARGEVQTTSSQTICPKCLEPFDRLGKEHYCPDCRIQSYSHYKSNAHVVKEVERMARRHYV